MLKNESTLHYKKAVIEFNKTYNDLLGFSLLVNINIISKNIRRCSTYFSLNPLLIVGLELVKVADLSVCSGSLFFKEAFFMVPVGLFSIVEGRLEG